EARAGRGRAAGELVVCAPSGAELAPGTAPARGERLDPGERVEDGKLVRRPREPALLELAAHRDEPFGDGGDVLPCRAPTPRVRARAAVREDAPRDDERLLALRPQLRQRAEGLVVRQVELGLDVGLGRAGADRGGVAARAEEQPDRAREDRLPRAG